ncbi:hypothetical protein DYI25_18090 [Mesobacillus boroniphilus]|uniref:Uncharacterized protein n=1 Tax=Mesobacillus boroniphilus TaxID=308892 RepID=A0A944CPA1_9BACI|nr:hypothetical protein [Mesobacillus boroniphilus]MBS8266336.1 hypothetical protein [Mesobacillus boroniphilus]
MNSIIIKRLTNLGSFVVIAGLILIFLSDYFGTLIADSWIMAQGGSADASTYQFKVKVNTDKFIIPGSILFGIGVSTLVYTYYKLFNLNENS